MTTPIFTCAKCGAKHPSPEKNVQVDPPNEEARKIWYAKADMFLAHQGDATSTEKLYASVERASMAYLSTLRNGCWQFPDTMTTVYGKGGYAAVCLDCHKRYER